MSGVSSHLNSAVSLSPLHLGDFQIFPQEVYPQIFRKLPLQEFVALRALSVSFKNLTTIELIVSKAVSDPGFNPKWDSLYTHCDKEVVQKILRCLFEEATLERQEMFFQKPSPSKERKLAIFNDLPSDLTKLVLYKPPELSPLARLRNLKELRLIDVIDPADSYAVLKNLTSLTHLFLKFAHHFWDSQMTCLEGLTNLQRLTFTDCALAGGRRRTLLDYSGLSYLTNLTNLVSLHINHSFPLRIDPQINVPSSLRTFTWLKTFELSSVLMSPQSFSVLQQMTNLTALNLEKSHDERAEGLSAESLQAIASLTQLKQLNLKGCTLLSKDEVRQIFSKSPHLQIQM